MPLLKSQFDAIHTGRADPSRYLIIGFDTEYQRYADEAAFRAIWDQAPSASEAARRLNDAKLETPKGTKWYPATVLSFAAVAGLI